ncbi:MAG: histidinol-phosphatase [Candidatus Thorarchaeota archaeon]
MDYHTHNRRCGHAKGEIEDYVKKAIEKNISEIGISDHFPLSAVIDDPELNERFERASMSVEEFPSYIEEIKNLQEKYKNKIAIRLSTELTFVTPRRALIRQKKIIDPFEDDVDYLLGAIHDIICYNKVIIIDPREDSEVLKKYSNEEITNAYVEKLITLVNTDYFDVIAHFDNYRVLFRPESPHYSESTWQKLLDLLDKIKNKGMAIEINTSGFLKEIGGQFPSDTIIKEIIQREIPIMLGSDAHSPQHVGFMFEEFIEKAKKWGSYRICSYEKREQNLVKI